MEIKLVTSEEKGGGLMFEGNMCLDKATMLKLEPVQAKLELAGIEVRDRSPSPIPGIQRALFQVIQIGFPCS